MVDWIIGTGVAVSLLIVLVLIIRRPFARLFGARAAYALWLLPYIRLVLPEVTIPRIFPKLSNSLALESTPPVNMALTPDMIATLQAKSRLMAQLESYALPSLFAIWIFGAVTFLLYHWTRQASLMDRLNYGSEPATPLRREISAAVQAAGLKRSPQVRFSDEEVGPLVAGFLRPTVIVPKGFMTAFSPAQRHYALMHEFMHVKRGDVWGALAWLGFRAVNWPNPIVHYAAKHFRSDQEAACDASVLSAMGDSQSAVTGYAETLIHAAKTAITTDNISGRASPTPSQLALTIHHPLKERLMILGTHRKISNWRSRTAAAVMIIGAATLSAPLIQADAHPEEELAGKYQTHQGTSVIKRIVEKGGKKTSEHFEINVDGDDVKAHRVEPSGEKIRVDVDDIESIHFADIGSFLTRDKNVLVIEGGDLKSLEGLQGLEGLKALESLEGSRTFTVFSDSGDEAKLEMHRTQSKLAAAQAILEDTEFKADNSREMAKAKRELEKARKALKAAERALKDAE